MEMIYFFIRALLFIIAVHSLLFSGVVFMVLISEDNIRTKTVLTMHLFFAVVGLMLLQFVFVI